MVGTNLSSVIEPMTRLLKKRSQKAGLPPGTPVFVGEKKVKEVTLSIIDFDMEKTEFKEVETVKECLPFKETPTVTWINIEGLHDVEVVDEMGKQFGIHPLTVEDILNTHQRPKAEIFEDYVFVAIKMNSLDEESGELETEQVSIILGKNFVLTFQEKRGDVFNPVRNRISGRGRVTKQGPDYLAYALIDSVVDNYFGIIEVIDERIESMEEELLKNPGPETLNKIHFLKSQLIDLRRSVRPVREIINGLQREETPLIKESTIPYLRDLYDHVVQVIDTVEMHRDIISGMLDVYLSSVSNRMNEVMKFLTIFATIFIPLTFIAGIYGMNFRFMPELEWKWGYFGVLGIMAAVGVSLLIYFRIKKWL